MSATFKVTSPAIASAGFLIGKAEWTVAMPGVTQSDTVAQRVRSAPPVKINEVRLGTGTNPTNQFIELYNAGDGDADISNWTLISTQSGWASVKLATIPAGTRLAAHGFYLLGLSSSGLAAPASPGATTVNVRSTTGLGAGQAIDVDGEIRTIANVGTAATAMTTVFVPVSTGPWLTIPAGSTNLPVTSATGFAVGQKIGIDVGGSYEVATVTEVGKAATQTTLVGGGNRGRDQHPGRGQRQHDGRRYPDGRHGRPQGTRHDQEHRQFRCAPGGGRGGRGGFGGGGSGGGWKLAAPLRFDHMAGVDVSDVGTGISFSPATRFAHRSGDAVQALGSGITLDRRSGREPRVRRGRGQPPGHDGGLPGAAGARSMVREPLSTSAGSIALMDASGTVRRRRHGLRITAEQLEWQRDHHQPRAGNPRG